MTTNGNTEPEAVAGSKPKTPFETAGKVVKTVDLRFVRYRSFSADALERGDSLSSESKLDASASFLRPTVIRDESGFTCRTTLVFQVTAKDQTSVKEPSKAALVIVRATVESVYVFKDGQQTFTDEELDDFAVCYCPFHVWGYWREFVQSSLARLEFPPFTLPLFLISHAPKMVRDKID